MMAGVKPCAWMTGPSGDPGKGREAHRTLTDACRALLAVHMSPAARRDRGQGNDHEVAGFRVLGVSRMISARQRRSSASLRGFRGPLLNRRSLEGCVRNRTSPYRPGPKGNRSVVRPRLRRGKRGQLWASRAAGGNLHVTLGKRRAAQQATTRPWLHGVEGLARQMEDPKWKQMPASRGVLSTQEAFLHSGSMWEPEVKPEVDDRFPNMAGGNETGFRDAAASGAVGIEGQTDHIEPTWCPCEACQSLRGLPPSWSPEDGRSRGRARVHSSG
ncbi:hypothetical protein F5X68DRAFT_75558 [Plectosphaerella plurivora]|uniref:Uncharacterized protein n=1 Tax=Plectosphaerella plurivora TaxID=936078 RepID=A0A9P9ABD9_9PEZI|nr:hypothetical protein F5X68DRAFT_75558 [Plectosphaerella plurivora]